MKLFEISIIGTFHTNHNEDFLTTAEIGNDKVLIAIMDGCSMGKESHFISTLMGKILRKKSKEISYREFVEQKKKTLKDYLFEITQYLFEELQFFKSRLLLEQEEILSTLILGVMDYKSKQAELLVIGDGLICCNGEYFEYDQDNKPDYVGYHLGKKFDDWFSSQTQKLSFDKVNDLSISSDGVCTFKKYDNKDYSSLEEQEILDFLFIDESEGNSVNMLKKKVLKIENVWGLKPSDDLSIIRIINHN